MPKEIPETADGQRASNLAEASRIADLLNEALAIGVARLDALVLLEHCAGRSRSQLLAFDDQTIAAQAAALFRTAAARRAAGEPLAYITGVREFWSLPLLVTPAVLIPRPETELLVQQTLDRLDAAPKLVADLGTGSGAIALALAKERPQWTVIGTDASRPAIEIALANRERLQVRNVALRLGAWCQALPAERFDAIVSNPPYIDGTHPALADLAYEPRSALVAADQGYADLRQIAAEARQSLRAGGFLLLEHGADQGDRLRAELQTLGYSQVATHQDLAGLDRVTTGVWP